MKILYIVSGVGPSAAWGSEYIQNLIFSLSQKGVQATIITPIYIHTDPKWKNWVVLQEKKLSLRIIPLDSVDFIKKKFLVHLALTPLLTTKAALKILSQEKFDLIHEFTSTPVIALRALFFKFLFNTPTIITLAVHNNTLLGNPFWFRLFNFAKYYLVPLQTMADRNKFIYSPPGINIPSFHKKISKYAARKKLNLPKDKFIITYFGPLTKEKGVGDIIQAIKITENSISKNTLFAFFTLPSKRFTKKQLLNNEIKSFKNTLLVEKIVDIPNLLASSDCIILPQQTGHGTTIPPISCIETVVSGKTLICTDIIGNRDLQEFSNVYLVPAKNPKKLAKTIIKISKTNQTESTKKSAAQFGIAHSVQKHLKIYRSLTS